MSFKRKLYLAFTLAFAIVSFSTFASAQDRSVNQEDSMQKQERRERRGFGKRGGGFGKRDGGGKHGGDRAMRHGLSQLNLTDAQKEQTRSIFEKYKTSTETQREEMRGFAMKKRDGIISAEEKARMKELKAQMRTASEQINKEVLAILTAEQRAQLDQMKEQMRKTREERRQLRQNRQTPNVPTDN